MTTYHFKCGDVVFSSVFLIDGMEMRRVVIPKIHSYDDSEESGNLRHGPIVNTVKLHKSLYGKGRYAHVREGYAILCEPAPNRMAVWLAGVVMRRMLYTVDLLNGGVPQEYLKIGVSDGWEGGSDHGWGKKKPDLQPIKKQLENKLVDMAS
jgi:hypothetical protein